MLKFELVEVVVIIIKTIKMQIASSTDWKEFTKHKWSE